MSGIKLYLAQRITALIMAPLVCVHLAVIIYAIQGGLDATEILSRTRGSFLWGSVYGLFVVAVSIHAAIGLRVVMFELLSLNGRLLELFTWLTGFGLFLLGSRGVYAMVLA